MAARSSSTAERSQPCNVGTSMIAAPSTAAPTSTWQLAQILGLLVEDRSSEANRSSKCLKDTRGELARKGLTHRRMSNDSPKIKWSCQRVNEQVGVGIPRQFSGRDGLLDQV